MVLLIKKYLYCQLTPTESSIPKLKGMPDDVGRKGKISSRVFMDFPILAEFVVRFRNKIISVERKISASHFWAQIGMLLK
jgi:hypothetical protein